MDTHDETQTEAYLLENRAEISRVLKKRMKEKKMTVRELGDRVGMFHGPIVRITNGKNCQVDTLMKVAEALDLEMVLRPRKDPE